MTEPDEPGVVESAPDGLIVIAFVYSQPEALVLTCTLRAYGIIAFPFDYVTLSVVPYWTVGFGGIRILVPASRRDDAIALLYEIDQGWVQPPRPYAREAWLDVLLGLFVFLYVWVPPPPRARGSYAWRRRDAKGLP